MAQTEPEYSGYPGSVFRGFTKETDAKNYLGIYETQKSSDKYVTEAIAYVDGSFNVTNGLYGSGVVLLHDGVENHFYQSGCDLDLAAMRNVAGEIIAAEMAVNYCLTNEIRSITIYYDYLGIFLWAIGRWKPNKEATMRYQAFMTNARQSLFIHFEKVTAHSGNYYNDVADKLAKRAVGLT